MKTTNDNIALVTHYKTLAKRSLIQFYSAHSGLTSFSCILPPVSPGVIHISPLSWFLLEFRKGHIRGSGFRKALNFLILLHSVVGRSKAGFSVDL